MMNSDMSMPGDGPHIGDGKAYWGPQLTTAILNGSLPIDRLNDAATRIVAAWYQLGQDDPERFPGPNFSSWSWDETGLLHPDSDDNTTAIVNQFKDVRGPGNEHSSIARQVAAEGSILVKNINDILPLSRNGASNQSKLQVGIYGEDAGPGRGVNACLDQGCNSGT
jgi:beta-glucosidase